MTPLSVELRLHHVLSGRPGRDLLVLSHSFGASMRLWDNVLPALEAEYRVLRYDMRGHGASSAPAAPCTVHDLAGDVLGLLDSIHVEHALFCGLSIGGLIGMTLALHAPHRLNALVLANTAARIGTPQMWDERIALVHQAGLAPLIPSALERGFTAAYRRDHNHEMQRAQQMIAATSVEGYCAGCAVLRDTDLRERISAIQVPTLVIAGAHDPVTTPSDGQQLAAAVRGSRYVELPAAHLSAWERPQDFARAILDFCPSERSNHG
ncbi:3-oxoadipate enol-lactonase [Acidobacteria bacterium AB60]|nr:3-oxoadipate enol-lactonase [Acidobacteria bacterium AB60]